MPEAKNRVAPVVEQGVPTDGGTAEVWRHSKAEHPQYEGLPCVPCCVIVPYEGTCPQPLKVACCDLPKSCCTCTLSTCGSFGACIDTCLLSFKACGACVGKCIDCGKQCIGCANQCIGYAKACANCPAMVCSKLTCGICCGPKKPKKSCLQRLTCGKCPEFSLKCCATKCCKTCTCGKIDCDSPDCSASSCCKMCVGATCKACTCGKVDCNSPDFSASTCCKTCVGPACKSCTCGKVNCDGCTDCTCDACCNVTFAGCVACGLGGCCLGCKGAACGPGAAGDFGESGYGLECGCCHVTLLPCCCKPCGPTEDLMTTGSFEKRDLHLDRMPDDAPVTTAVAPKVINVAPKSPTNFKPQTSVPVEMSMQR